VRFHATDKIEADRIKFFVKNADIFTLPNLPRPIQAGPRQKDGAQLKLVFIGRVRNNKNLLYAIRVLSKCSVEVSLDVYGPIEDKNYWAECAALIRSLKPHIQVHYKGLLAHGDVPRTLLEYHGLFLPTETENFGHAIVEAMQSGVVPIISDQTPWRHLREYSAGWDIDLRQPDLFQEAVHQLHAMDASAYGDLSAKTIRYIQEKLKIDQLALKYSRTFRQEEI
jgi:glycosyltransferase involved in cell wall biosynthesis